MLNVKTLKAGDYVRHIESGIVTRVRKPQAAIWETLKYFYEHVTVSPEDRTPKTRDLEEEICEVLEVKGYVVLARKPQSDSWEIV